MTEAFRLPLVGVKPNRFQLKLHRAQEKERWGICGNRAGKSSGSVHDVVMDGFGVHIWRPRFPTSRHAVDVWRPFEDYDEASRSVVVAPREIHSTGDPLYEQEEELRGRAEMGRLTWWSGAPDYQNVWKPNNYELFVAAFRGIGLKEGTGPNQYEWRETDRVFRIPVSVQSAATGTKYEWLFEVYAKSYASGRELFQGSGIAGFHADEEIPEAIYNESMMRLMKGFELWFLASMTPVDGLPWIKEKIVDTEEIGQLESWRTLIRGSLFDNLQNLPEGEADRILQKFPEGSAERRVRVYGEHVSKTGLIYPEFDIDTHIVDDFKPWASGERWRQVWTLYRALDIGYRNPTACLFIAVNKDGEHFVFQEYYEAELKLDQHARNILAMSGKHPFRLTVVDPAASATDPHTGTSSLDFLTQHGLICVPGNNDVVHGIAAVSEMLRVGKSGRPRLFFCRGCANTIREIRTYRWQDQGRSQVGRLDPREKPMKRNDHAMDTVRYAAMANFTFWDDELELAYDTYIGNSKTGY